MLTDQDKRFAWDFFYKFKGQKWKFIKKTGITMQHFKELLEKEDFKEYFDMVNKEYISDYGFSEEEVNASIKDTLHFDAKEAICKIAEGQFAMLTDEEANQISSFSVGKDNTVSVKFHDRAKAIDQAIKVMEVKEEKEDDVHAFVGLKIKLKGDGYEQDDDQ